MIPEGGVGQNVEIENVKPVCLLKTYRSSVTLTLGSMRGLVKTLARRSIVSVAQTARTPLLSRSWEVRRSFISREMEAKEIHSVRCSNCQNSLAVKIMGSQKKLHIKGDGRSIVSVAQTARTPLLSRSWEVRRSFIS